MDLIYRKEKYERFLKKLDKLKGNNVVNEELDHVNIMRDGVNDILEDLRDKSDLEEIRLIYTLLIVPLVIILGLYCYLQSLFPALYVIIALLLFFAMASFMMKSAIKENKILGLNQGINKSSDETFLSSKIIYASSAIGIKEKRNELVQIFYVVFFPLLIYFAFWLIFDYPPFDDAIIGLLLAYLLGSPLWYYFFDQEKMDLKKTREILDNYRRQFKAI